METPGQELSSLAFDRIIGGALDAVVKAQSNASLTTVSFIKNTGFKLNEKGEATEPIYVAFKYPKEVKPYQPGTPEIKQLKVVRGGRGYDESMIKEITLDNKKVDVQLTITDGVITGAQMNGEITSANGTALGIVLQSNAKPAENASIVVEVIKAEKATPAEYENMELKVPILTMLPVPFIRIATTDIEFNVKINSMSSSASESTHSDTKEGGGSAGYAGFGFKANATFNASVSNQRKSSSTEEIKKEYSLNIKVHAVQDDLPAGISRVLDILEESIVPHHTNLKTA